MSRPIRFTVGLLLLAVLAAGTWWQRQLLLRQGLELALTLAGLGSPKIGEVQIASHRAEFRRCEFDLQTQTGPMVVKLEQFAVEYDWRVRKLGEVNIARADIRFDYQPEPASEISRSTSLSSWPLAHLVVERLVLEANTPWGQSVFDGRAEFASQADQSLSATIQDGHQVLHFLVTPNLSLADLSIDQQGLGKVLELHAENLNRTDKRGSLRASIGHLQQWLSQSPLLPSPMREHLAAAAPPDMAPLQLRFDFDTTDAFAGWHGWLLLTVNDDYLASADLSKPSPSRAVIVDAHLDMPAPQFWAWLRPWLPAGPMAGWQLAGGRVQATSRLHWQASHEYDGIAHFRVYDWTLTAGSLKAAEGGLEIEVKDIAKRNASLSLSVARIELDKQPLALTDFDTLLHSQGKLIKVDHATVNAFGGQLALLPEDVDLEQSPLQLTLGLQGIELQQLLAMLNYPQLSGSGRINGKLPLSLSRDAVSVQGGNLSGDQPGVLRYGGPATDESNIAFKALRNLVYHKLQAALDYQPSGDYRLGLRLEGKNPELMAGHPLAFNLNLSGHLPDLLQRSLLSGDFERSVLEESRRSNPSTPSEATIHP